MSIRKLFEKHMGYATGCAVVNPRSGEYFDPTTEDRWKIWKLAWRAAKRDSRNRQERKVKK